jgi:hypothetical protein
MREGSTNVARVENAKKGSALSAGEVGARMPIRMVVLVARRPDLSHEEFRRGYETSHAPLAVRLFGHLWLSYRRNYVRSSRNFAGVHQSLEYDAISEFVLRDAAALEEMGRIGVANQKLIHEDEERWFDRARCWIVSCETIEDDFLRDTERG